jgi:glycosyltransferase involved in cell wall biosynthesis
VIVPSRREGLGLVAAEALARGRPVVASRVGGLPELLAAPGTGLLVLPDDVAALATALCRLPLPAPAPAALGRRLPAAVGADHRRAYEAMLDRVPVPAR